MMGELPQPVPVRRSVALLALRSVLALVFVLIALTLLALQGRPASPGEFIEDLQAGRVTHVVATDDDVIWWTGGLRPWDANTPLIVDNGAYYRDRIPALLARYAPARHVDVRQQRHRLPGAVLALGVTAGLTTLLLLVAGPEPALATRWGWFWLLGLGGASGLGIVAFLLLSDPDARWPRWRRHRERWDGATAFGIAILFGILVQLGWLVLRHLLWPASDGSASYVTPKA